MIVQLPKILIDQIAAGEVVVRPASVAKELVENSIDAQARHVTVTVGNALRDVAVVDDGVGISRDDAELALQRHATSKIRSIDDLHSIRTRGFRGEALPSIAAVSRLVLTTRRTEDLAATRIVVEGGEVDSIDSAGAPPGTNVSVRELFYNTPARLKFLKTAATEVGQMMRVIVRQALAAPSLAFRFVNQQRVLLDLPAGQSLLTRAQQLLGVETDNLLEVRFEKYGVRISGYIAKPLEARRDRRHQFFFVNDRPISHRSLHFSLQQAYEGLITVQRYPIVAIFIEIPPDEVDVNVHPTKEEVRFREENKIAGLVHRATVEALHAANLTPQIRLPDEPAPDRAAKPPDYLDQFRQASGALHPPAAPYETPSAQAPRTAPVGPPDAPRIQLDRETDDALDGQARPPDATPPEPPGEIDPAVDAPTGLEDSPTKPLGQIADTYIVAEAGEDLLVIDQHAAHERLLYLQAKQEAGRVATQPLLIPISVEVRPSNRPHMEELAPVLEKLGFETEPFGGQTFVVRSVPAMFDQVDIPAFIDDLLDDVAREGAARESDRLRERILIRLACHGAIKAGQHLQPAEMQRLVDDLLAARLSYTCPHGRPTMIRLTRDQLDRQFKRK